MAYFQTKILVWENVMAICSILRPLGIFCGRFVHFVVIWYIFPFCTKKSGNPAHTRFFPKLLFQAASFIVKKFLTYKKKFEIFTSATFQTLRRHLVE
jgi:hypothetical protein